MPNAARVTGVKMLRNKKRELTIVFWNIYEILIINCSIFKFNWISDNILKSIFPLTLTKGSSWIWTIPKLPSMCLKAHRSIDSLRISESDMKSEYDIKQLLWDLDAADAPSTHNQYSNERESDLKWLHNWNMWEVVYWCQCISEMKVKVFQLNPSQCIIEVLWWTRLAWIANNRHFSTQFHYFLISKKLSDEFPFSALYINVLMTCQPQALSIVIKE